jgi:hypothetical protein
MHDRKRICAEQEIRATELRGDVRRALRSARHGVQAGVVVAGLVASTSVLGALFPPEIDLSSLLVANGGDGTVGFAINGYHIEDNSGHQVARAGDINGDGIDDFVVGSHVGYYKLGRGETYVIFGQAGSGFPPELELSALYARNGGDGSLGVVFHGNALGDASGYSVGPAGDVNGDGIDDLVIGSAPPGPAGIVQVVFGRAEGFPAEVDLSELYARHGGDGSRGVVIRAPTAFRSGAFFGHAGPRRRRHQRRRHR